MTWRAALTVLALAPGLAVAQQKAPAGDAQGTPPAAERSSARQESEGGAAPGAKASESAPGAKAKGETAPQARDLARALTTPKAWGAILDGFASVLSGQIAGALSATGKEPPKDLEEKVRKDLGDAVQYEQAVEMQARALAGRFSADELRELESFYRSGPGKKLLEELPEVARQVNDELHARLSERVPKIVERYAPSLAASPEQAEPGAAPKAQGRTPPAETKPQPRR